jgi:hypothetical protein
MVICTLKKQSIFIAIYTLKKQSIVINMYTEETVNLYCNMYTVHVETVNPHKYVHRRKRQSLL